MWAPDRYRLSGMAAAALSMAAVTAIAATAHAEDVFTDLDYEEAFEHAVEQEKIYFVHGTAVWCGPCRMMEQNTYPDETLADWMAEHVVAYKLDVDQEADRAQQLGISAMPTMIFFRQGEEYGRVTGYRGPDQLLGLFKAVHNGEELPADPAAQRNETQQKIVEAWQAVRDGDFDRAGELASDLWQSVREMDRLQRRQIRSQLPMLMEEVVASSDKWLERFAAFRDEAKRRLDRPALREWQDLVDWVELNHVLSEDHVTFKWFDRVKESEDAWPTIRRLDDTLRDILVEHGRWADLLVTYRDPLTTIKSEIEAAEKLAPRLESAYEQLDLDKEERDRMIDQAVQSQRDELLRTAARLYTACLAAGRDELGRKIIETVLEHEDPADVLPTVIDTALTAGQVRDHQMQWLEQAGGFDGRDELETRLRTSLTAARVGD